MAQSGDKKDVRIQETEDLLRFYLAEYIKELAHAAISERRIFNIALSGDSLITLMGKLHEAPYNTIDWIRWQIFCADEGVTDAESNYKLAKDSILDALPVCRAQVHSIDASLTAKKAAKDYYKRIREIVKNRDISPSLINDCPKFDLVLLEMGDDGHIASLFPNHPVLNEKDKWVAYMTDSPQAPLERVTFTLLMINTAANVAIVATGEDKADAVHLAIDHISPESPVVPARMVQPVEGKLVWFLDKAAASKLVTPCPTPVLSSGVGHGNPANPF